VQKQKGTLRERQQVKGVVDCTCLRPWVCPSPAAGTLIEGRVLLQVLPPHYVEHEPRCRRRCLESEPPCAQHMTLKKAVSVMTLVC